MQQVLNDIKKQLVQNPKRPFLIAIDGNCGSGKTTLGSFLKEQLHASLFHMDDFFLQPHQRTEERLSAPGGNVDYERFQQEILDHVTDDAGITYRPYSCKHRKLADAVTEPYHDIIIIEGSYSHHPYFKDIYDLKIFLEIPPEEQKKRIINRAGEAVWPVFREKWIPLENQYFEAMKIRENSDVSYCFLSILRVQS